jgi:hypothetical protein
VRMDVRVVPVVATTRPLGMAVRTAVRPLPPAEELDFGLRRAQSSRALRSRGVEGRSRTAARNKNRQLDPWRYHTRMKIRRRYIARQISQIRISTAHCHQTALGGVFP